MHTYSKMWHNGGTRFTARNEGCLQVMKLSAVYIGLPCAPQELQNL